MGQIDLERTNPLVGTQVETNNGVASRSDAFEATPLFAQLN